MWHTTRIGALASACRLIGVNVDPELLDCRAREHGIELPVESGMTSAPSLGRSMIAHQVPLDRHPELRAAVERVLATSKKAA
jgi:hypothetical protein